MIFFKPFIKWKKELESKSSDKWLQDAPCDDITIGGDHKMKRIPNNKGIGYSMPHIPNDYNFPSSKQDYYQDGAINKMTYIDQEMGNKHRMNIHATMGNTADDNNNKRNPQGSVIENQQQYDINLQNAYSSYSSISYPNGNQQSIGAEDLYVPYLYSNSTVPAKKTSVFRQRPKNAINPVKVIAKNHPRPTFSATSLDTALLLQDTEALLNDMEKRVYLRKEKIDDKIKSKVFPSNIIQGERIPYVDETEERDDNSELFSYVQDPEERGQIGLRLPSQSMAHNEQIALDTNNRSYGARSPLNSGIIKRNNSCKLGTSESMNLSRKLNATLKNQRSCSMIEEQRQHFQPYNNNNNFDLTNDYCSKSKPQGLAMNSGTYMNLRGSGGISSGFNSSISRLEPSSLFSNNISAQRSKDPLPYFSTNLLSLHRQRLNRYEYGQHSLKYNSNSTTMLYNKYNNTSPPWNRDDPEISRNTFYPTYDNEYHTYNHIPYPPDTLFSKQEPNGFNNNSQMHTSNLDLNPENDFMRRDDTTEYLQPCCASGRSSAFSPVNSLHQSTDSINNYGMASKSRSTVGINEQRHCNYDTLLVSSVHQYSARLCRYTEEIVHRMKREGSEFQGTLAVDAVFDQSDVFSQIKSVNRELQETVSNLRTLEKHLQKVEKILFPSEKSGRNSNIGNCTENNYLNQLERINKELQEFVPINSVQPRSNKSIGSKLLEGSEYLYFSENDQKDLANYTPIPSMEKIILKSLNSDTQLDLSKVTYKDSEIYTPPKPTFSLLSKRF